MHFNTGQLYFHKWGKEVALANCTVKIKYNKKREMFVWAKTQTQKRTVGVSDDSTGHMVSTKKNKEDCQQQPLIVSKMGLIQIS